MKFYRGFGNLNTLLFDCTPDVSHNEQMSEIIRYIYIANGKVKIEESFIDFIITEEKIGKGSASDTTKKLQDDHLDIQDARGQGYDNGAIWRETIVKPKQKFKKKIISLVIYHVQATV